MGGTGSVRSALLSSKKQKRFRLQTEPFDERISLRSRGRDGERQHDLLRNRRAILHHRREAPLIDRGDHGFFQVGRVGRDHADVARATVFIDRHTDADSGVGEAARHVIGFDDYDGLRQIGLRFRGGRSNAEAGEEHARKNGAGEEGGLFHGRDHE